MLCGFKNNDKTKVFDAFKSLVIIKISSFMKNYMILMFLAILMVHCSNVEKPKVQIDFNLLPCDLVDQSNMAKMLGYSVVDIIFQTGTNDTKTKVCTYYKKLETTSVPLLFVTLEKNTDTLTNNYEVFFKDMISTGLSGGNDVPKYDYFPDKRFKAIYSNARQSFHQVLVDVDNQYLLTLEYDTSLTKGKDNFDFAAKLVEAFLYRSEIQN